MPIAVEDLEDGLTRVRLSGRIDIAGANEIDMPMSLVAGTRRAVVIDLAEVEFMASMGLRCLVVTGKSILGKKGRVVLLAPQAAVADVLQSSGIDELLPIHPSWEDAAAAVRPG